MDPGSPQTISDNTPTDISWDNEIYDHGGWFDAGSPDDFTIPGGVSLARASAQILWAISGTGNRTLFIRKNNADFKGNGFVTMSAPTASGASHFVETTILEVTSGDTLQVRVTQDSGDSLDVQASNSTWFNIEKVG